MVRLRAALRRSIVLHRNRQRCSAPPCQASKGERGGLYPHSSSGHAHLSGKQPDAFGRSHPRSGHQVASAPSKGKTRMRLKYLSVTLSALVSMSAISWGAQEFKIEPGWSQIEFGVRNLGIHTVEGQFKGFSGTVTYDETDVTRSSVAVTIQIASIDTGIKK